MSVPEPNPLPPEPPPDPADRALADYVADVLDHLADGRPLPEPTDPRLAYRAARARDALTLLDRARRAGGHPFADGDAPAAPNLPARVGRFRVVRELGRGGAGVVYLADDPALGREVAVKLLSPAAGSPHSSPDRFRAEGGLLAKQHHPNIVQVFETGGHDGRPYLAMEYVAGPNLHAHLAGQPMPPAAAAELAESLARAVAYAHGRGIVHRDLKPSNVLLSGPGADGRFVPKVSDFGLATTLGDRPGLTRSGELVGTPNYLAPELLDPGGRAASVRVDVYGLGAVLYECLTGRPPFSGANVALTLIRVQTTDPTPPRRLAPGVPPDLETICLTCLHKDPTRRYQSADAVADDLAAFRAGRPVAARPVGVVETAVKWARRNRPVAFLLAALALALVGGTAGSAYFAVVAGRRAAREAVAAAAARDAEAAARAAQQGSALLAARLRFQEAVRQAEVGSVGAGLAGMIEALRLAPADPGAAEFRRTVRLGFAAWAGQLPLLRYATPLWPRPPTDAWVYPVGPDGAVAAAWAKDEPLRMIDPSSGRDIGPPWSLPPDEWPLVVSADGDLLLTRVGDGSVKPAVVRLRATRTGEPVAGPLTVPWLKPRPAVPQHPSCVLSPKAVMTGGLDTAPWGGPRRFWDLTAGTQYPLTVSDIDLRAVRLTRAADGTPLAVAVHQTTEGTLRAFRATFRNVTTGATAEPGLRLDGRDDPRVHADGRVVVTPFGDETGMGSSAGGTVAWWEVGTGRLLELWRPGREAFFSTAGPDSQTLVGCGSDERVRLYDLDTGLQRGGDIPLNERLLMNTGGGAHPTEPVFVAAHRDGVLRAWETRHLGRQATAAARPLDRPHAPGHRVVRFGVATLSSGGRYVVFADGPDGYVRLVDTVTGNPVGPPLVQPNGRLVAFTPDERAVVTATRNFWHGGPQSVQVIDTATGKPRIPPVPFPTYIHGIGMSPDGKVLAVARNNATSLLDLQSGEMTQTFVEKSCATAATFAPDGRSVLVGYRTGWGGLAGVRQWNPLAGRAEGPFRPFQEHIAIPAFHSAAGGRAVLAFDPGARDIHLVDAATGESRVAVTLPQRAEVATVRGRTLAVGYKDATVAVWDLDAGRPVGPEMPQPAAIVGLEFSPDGKLLAVTGADRAVRLWDVATRLPVGPPRLHSADVLAVRFAPGGSELVTATAAGEVRRWRVPAPVPDDPNRLELWLQAATGRGPTGESSPLLSPDGWKAKASELKAVWPEASDFLPRPTDIAPADDTAWHAARAGEAEATGNVFAARWHRQRLARLRPTDWTAHARLGDALAAAADLAGRDAADAAARRLAPPGAVDDWIAHRSAGGPP